MNTRSLARRCAPLLLTLALAAPMRAQNAALDTPASHDAQIERVLQLKGQDFDQAMRKLSIGFTKTSPTLPALRRLLDRLEAERRARQPTAAVTAATSPANSRGEWTDPFHELQFSHSNVVRLISQVGEEQDYQRLLRIYDTLPVDYWMQGVFFEALSQMWIRRELPALLKSASKVSVAPSPEPLPANLQGTASPLVGAWRLYRGVAIPFSARFSPAVQSKAAEPAIPKIEVQQSWPAFYKVISDFFHGRGQNTVEKIAAFEWGSWCGMGSEQLYAPRNRVLFMALCQQKRFDLALGALMAGADRSSFRGGAKVEWPQAFIAACGLDWETLYAGAVLDGGYRTEEMASQGGEISARLLEAMSTLPWIAGRDDYLKAVAAFVVPAPFSSGAMPEMVAGLRLIGRPAVAPDQQKRLLEILHAQIKPQAGMRIAREVSSLLGELRRPESVEVLKRALKLPFSRVRYNAFQALKEMGQEVQEPSMMFRADFRVLLNGQPLKGTPLEYQIQTKGPGGSSSSGETDQGGVLQMERDYLEDTQRETASLQFTSRPLKSPGDAWIEASFPIPADLDRRNDIAIATQSLMLKVAPGPGVAKTMMVRLKSERHHSYGVYFETISDWLPVPTDRATTFSQLQHGRYQIQVLAAGAARWESPEITLGARPETVEATLQKGADVHFELLAPGGQARDRNPESALMPTDGPPDRYKFYDYLDYATQTYRGLPVGNYKVQIKASRARQQNGRVTIPPAPPYEGEERTFRIDAQSPPLIELGTIVLKAAAAG